ncbi:MAG: alpha/beta fold hydrolase [Candidatus Dadabacteria bacterium]|nr:MAG: alpha/beta fold hydrolase [Candidatus Dadabacteria bacterium]
MIRYPTLIVHGFLATRATNLPVHLALRRYGFRTYNVTIPGWNTQDIRDSAAAVGEKAAYLKKKYDSDRINIVGVSMGGVIALYYVRCAGGHVDTRRTVLLGSPVRGTAAADVLAKLGLGGKAARQMAPGSPIIKAMNAPDVPEADIVSIYADGDAVVPPEAARVAGGRNIKAPIGTWPMGHYQLVLDPRNLAFMAQELLRPGPDEEDSLDD